MRSSSWSVVVGSVGKNLRPSERSFTRTSIQKGFSASHWIWNVFSLMLANFQKITRAKTLAGSLDLLHVAAAHLTGCTTFVSGDERQLTVAKATGLAVVDIKRRAAR